MNVQNEFSDEKFVPFLHSLGVETYKKSFEWMSNDPAFAGILLWLYNNLDQNNALSAHEEYRYAELQKKGLLLSQDTLEATVKNIQQDYPGICLPGDKDGLEEVKQDICMQKERLHVLEKQEKVYKDLIVQNELVKDDLNIQITKLNSACKQYTEDEQTLAQECLQLAEKAESLMDGVVDTIADSLNVYSKCHVDKETARKFLIFSPLDPYRQSQALFRSHFDLYTSKKFKAQQDSATDEELNAALCQAKDMESRLLDAASSYIELRAELVGEQAKLMLASNYNHVHPSQVTAFSLEAHSAVELLSQEECILEQQIRAATRQLVSERTRLVVDTATLSALAVREKIHTELSHLLDVSQQALCLDRLLYYALRHELRTVEDFLQFASQLRDYVISEADAIASRVDSMNKIHSEQMACENNLQTSDYLMRSLASILGTSYTDPGVLVKIYKELVNRVKELREDVRQGYRRKKRALDDFKSSLQPLRSYIYDGSTKQANSRDPVAAALSRSVLTRINDVEKLVVKVGGLFTTAKNSHKQNLRKLWQWFLTDETRFLAALRGGRNS